jgi:hypothetical protein
MVVHHQWQETASYCRIGDLNYAFLHGAFEHGVHKQIKAHAGAISRDGSLPKGDDKEIRIAHLYDGFFALQLGDPIRDTMN